MVKVRWRAIAWGLLVSVLAQAGQAQAQSVSIHVDATNRGRPLRHVWSYYGYDECNYTTTADCIDLMEAVAAMKYSLDLAKRQGWRGRRYSV